MRLRQMTLNDAAAYRLWGEPETPHMTQVALMRKQLADRDERAFTAVDGRSIVGHGRIRWFDGYEEIGWFVAPSARGHGYGTSIALCLITLCRSEHVVALVSPMNQPSWRIAKRLGFQPCGFDGLGHIVWHLDAREMRNARSLFAVPSDVGAVAR